METVYVEGKTAMKTKGVQKMTTTIDRVHKRYRDWMQNKTSEEQALHLQAIEYQERYFKDLTLRE